MRGWSRVGDLWLNTGVDRDPHARERGGSVAFDPSTLATLINPWCDGSLAELWHTPILPDGTRVGTPEELEHGWAYPCTGPLERIEVVDLQLTNKLSYLREFGGEGLKVIWWLPAAQVKDDGGGWWRPKRTAISGPGAFEAYEQPATVEEGEERPNYAKGSIAYYGADDRRGVILRPDGSILKAYHSGKIFHSPRPTALFWSADGRLLGIVYGKLEWDAANAHEVKAYPIDQCAALVAAGAVKVSIDATLGYTSIGASSTAGRSLWAGPYTASENGNITTLHAAYSVAAGGLAYMALYTNSAGSPAGQALVGNSRSADKTISGTGWNVFTATNGPAFQTGRVYHFFTSYTTNLSSQINHDIGGASAWTNTGVFYANPPDPAPTPLSAYSSRRLSLYATYTPPVAYLPTVHTASDGDLVAVGKFAVRDWEHGAQLRLRVADWKTRLKVEIPPNRYDQTTYPNMDPNAAGQSIPVGFGKLFDLPCTLIDSTTKTFKVLDHSVVTFDEMRADGAPITPTSIDLTHGEFVWDGYDPENPATLTADVATEWTNPADVISRLLVTYAGQSDLLVPVDENDPNYRKGFGAYGSRLAWMYGATSDGVEAHCPSISLYISTPTDVLDVIGQVITASFGRFYYAPEGYWFLDQWESVRGANVVATFHAHEIFELTPRVSSSERITSITLNYRKYESSGLVQILAMDSEELRHLGNLRQNISASRDYPSALLRDAQWYGSRVLAMEGRPLKTWEVTVNQRGWTLRPGQVIRVVYPKRAVDAIFEVLEVNARPGETPVDLLLGDNRGFADRPCFVTVDSPTFPASLGGGSAATWDAGWTAAQKTYARQNFGYVMDDNGFNAGDRDSYKGSVIV